MSNYQGPEVYNWLHIPSGKQGITPWSDHYRMEGVNKYLSLCDKLKAVNEWNSKAPSVWKYWL